VVTHRISARSGKTGNKYQVCVRASEWVCVCPQAEVTCSCPTTMSQCGFLLMAATSCGCGAPTFFGRLLRSPGIGIGILPAIKQPLGSSHPFFSDPDKRGGLRYIHSMRRGQLQATSFATESWGISQVRLAVADRQHETGKGCVVMEQMAGTANPPRSSGGL